MSSGIFPVLFTCCGMDLLSNVLFWNYKFLNFLCDNQKQKLSHFIGLPIMYSRAE